MSAGIEDWEELDTISSTDDCLTPSTIMSEKNHARQNDSETPPGDTSREEVNETPPEDTSKEKEKENKSTPKDTSKENENKSPSKEPSKGTKSGSPQNDPPSPMKGHPTAGRTFMMRTSRKPHRILTQKGGDMDLLENPIQGGGAFWDCHEKNNFYGFCNSVSGTYLGHNEKGKVLATKNCHEINEYFVTKRADSGGYILLTLHEKEHEKELRQIAISEDGKSLVEQKEGGEAWDFIDVKHFNAINMPAQLLQ